MIRGLTVASRPVQNEYTVVKGEGTGYFSPAHIDNERSGWRVRWNLTARI